MLTRPPEQQEANVRNAQGNRAAFTMFEHEFDTDFSYSATTVRLEPKIVKTSLADFAARFGRKPASPHKRQVNTIAEQGNQRIVLDDDDDDIEIVTAPALKTFIDDLMKSKKGKAIAETLTRHQKGETERQKNSSKAPKTFEWLQKAARETRMKIAMDRQEKAKEDTTNAVLKQTIDHSTVIALEGNLDKITANKSKSEEHCLESPEALDSYSDELSPQKNVFDMQDSNFDNDTQSFDFRDPDITMDSQAAFAQPDKSEWTNQIAFTGAPAAQNNDQVGAPLREMLSRLQKEVFSAENESRDLSPTTFEETQHANIVRYGEQLKESAGDSFSQHPERFDGTQSYHSIVEETSRQSMTLRDAIMGDMDGCVAPKRRRLVRATETTDEQSETPLYESSVPLQKKYHQEKEQLLPIQRPEFVHEEADVEEDEFMNLGGADGENLEAEQALREELRAFIDEDDETLASMSIAQMQELMKQDDNVRHFFNDQIRAKDLKDTKQLVKDITTGKILDRRKHKQTGQTERDKFGRAEDDEEDLNDDLRELDDALDYGVFGDVIAKYVAIRREVHRKNTMRQRKRNTDKTDGGDLALAFQIGGSSVDTGETDHDWTNEGGDGVGEIHLAPGQSVETDLDRLEERATKRAAFNRLEQQRSDGGPLNGFESGDEDDESFLKCVNNIQNMIPTPRHLQRQSPNQGPVVVSMLSRKVGVNQRSASGKVIRNRLDMFGPQASGLALQQLKDSVGLTGTEMKILNGGFVPKEKSGFVAQSGGGHRGFGIAQSSMHAATVKKTSSLPVKCPVKTKPKLKSLDMLANLSLAK